MAGLRLGVFALATLVMLPAQDEGIDLEAIAAELEAEGCPEVRPLLPEGIEEWSRAVTGDTSREVLVATIRASADGTPATVAAAVRVLMQEDAERETEAGLLAEIEACDFLDDVRRARQKTHKVMVAAGAAPHWFDQIGPAAGLRARALQARVLRHHGDTPAAGAVLFGVRRQVDAADPEEVLAAASARLGRRWNPIDLLMLAHDALRRLDFAAVESTLQRAESAARDAPPRFRELVLDRTFELRLRLQKAREIELRPADSTQGRALRKLQVLQLCSVRRAVSLSEELIAEGIEHALPYSVLASAALTQQQDPRAALEMLERAKAMPGRGLTYAALSNWLELLPLARQMAAAPGDDRDAARKALALLTDLDGVLSTDRSDIPTIYRWLRAEGLIGTEPGLVLPRDSLDAAKALSRSLPQSKKAYLLLLFAAECAEDHAAARAAVAAPVPPALRSLPSLRRRQATTWLLLERWQSITFGPTVTALNSALATAFLRNRNEAGVRQASARALAALREYRSGTSTARPAPGRGVVAFGYFRYGFGVVGARPNMQIEFDLDLWVVPKLPSEAELERMAEGG